MTTEQLAQIAAILSEVAPDPAVAAARNRLLAVRDGLLKSLNAVNDALAAIDGGVAVQPSVTPSAPVEIPIPPSLAPPPEKKSKWAKVGGFFKKVWPVASIALVAVPGGAAIAAGVNAAMGAGTADATTAAVAGLVAPVAAAVVKGMSKE